MSKFGLQENEQWAIMYGIAIGLMGTVLCLLFEVGPAMGG